MSKYYATYYEEYPIYEAAEGGYYYAGRQALDLEDNEYDTIEDAINDVREWVANELKEVDGEWVFAEQNLDAKEAREVIDFWVNDYGPEEGRVLIAFLPSKYIGEGAQIYIEIPEAYRKYESGWHPYE